MTNVCPRCFDDAGLKKRIEEIRPHFPNEKCSFHSRYKGIPNAEVATIVDGVFRQHYGFGDYMLVPRLDSDRVDHVQQGSDLTDIIYDLTEAVDDDITEAMVRQLIEGDDYWPPDGEEPFYMEDQNYVRFEATYVRHSELWNNFCNSIVHSQRFFNSDAKELIAEIFDGIQFQRDKQKQSPVYQIKPGDQNAVFFRARIADDRFKQKKIAKDPATELGPPPERMRRAGRMNPAGIACFYGAYEFDTCVAELRPAVGSTVVGAQFELTRPIHVLDTTRFKTPIKPISLFSKHHMQRVEQWTFMRRFQREIAKPISPNDEHLDYIPTQAVAEYLLNHHNFKRSGKNAQIEAIIFQSAQFRGGRNIVLLGDAAQIRMPKVTDLKEKKSSSSFKDILLEPFESFLSSQNQPSNPGVILIEKSLRTHRVISSKFESEVMLPIRHDEDLDFQ
jgi:hypothetical protein